MGNVLRSFGLIAHVISIVLYTKKFVFNAGFAELIYLIAQKHFLIVLSKLANITVIKIFDVSLIKGVSLIKR